ncbi:MAG: murein biosynthesis integral membrane protein MurJ, partial [Opitutales bacterium]|nr:murein biosynthesis integral membrane protein MurJ [Opitutales bacterium]
MLNHISTVSFWTLVSRVLGLLRDVLLFAVLGAGLASSAFIFAFTLPNLFRRLFGEGALMSSSIPVLSEVDEKEGRAASFSLLNGILTRLFIWLTGLTLIGLLLAFLAGRLPNLEARWYLALELSQLLFPYVVLICLSALICGMLQTLSRFLQPAMSQVWLNLCMIAALGIGWFAFDGDSNSRVWLLAGGVLFGGILQLAIPAFDLARSGWRPAWDLGKSGAVDQVWRLFGPGLLGAAIFQINIFVSRFLAFTIDDAAAGLLYLAARLVELPLGVFAIAISTVIFPQLSRHAALRDLTGFDRLYRKGLRFIFIITLPATAGLIVLAEPVLRLLFEWGLFSAADTRAAVPVLIAAVLGMPFFAWSTFLTRAFYAFQDMRRPMRLAALSLVVNLCLSLLLMQFWGAAGLALANALSSALHCLLLHNLLKIHIPSPPHRPP